MAQTTAHLSAKNVKLEISTNGTTWTDISGSSNSIAPSGGARPVAEAYTFDGDNPLVTVGKSQPLDLVIGAVYTEVSADVFETIRPIFDSGGDIHVRWSPKGGTTGNKMLTCGPGKVSAFNYPSATASEAAVIMTGFTYRGPRPTVSTVV